MIIDLHLQGMQLMVRLDPAIDMACFLHRTTVVASY
jgi:hypothetical protein